MKVWKPNTRIIASWSQRLNYVAYNCGFYSFKTFFLMDRNNVSPSQLTIFWHLLSKIDNLLQLLRVISGFPVRLSNVAEPEMKRRPHLDHSMTVLTMTYNKHHQLFYRNSWRNFSQWFQFISASRGRTIIIGLNGTKRKVIEKFDNKR